MSHAATASRLKAAVPQFTVPDLLSTTEYYRDVLGFRIAGYYGSPPVFGIVSRDEVQVFFNRSDGSEFRTGKARGAGWTPWPWSCARGAPTSWRARSSGITSSTSSSSGIATDSCSPSGRIPVDKSRRLAPQWIAIGIAIGAGIGVATNNIAIWVGIGVALGVAMGLTFARRK